MQVALIMLIGLVGKKNAILIVEFAVQRRKAGQPLVAAAIEAARLRLRPIIMTSMAFVFGLFPMSIATGPSAQGNHSISIGAAGGMVSGVILGLFIIPVLFVIFQSLQEKITGVPVAVLMDGQGHSDEKLNGHIVAELQKRNILLLHRTRRNDPPIKSGGKRSCSSQA